MRLFVSLHNKATTGYLSRSTFQRSRLNGTILIRSQMRLCRPSHFIDLTRYTQPLTEVKHPHAAKADGAVELLYNASIAAATQRDETINRL